MNGIAGISNFTPTLRVQSRLQPQPQAESQGDRFQPQSTFKEYELQSTLSQLKSQEKFWDGVSGVTGDVSCWAFAGGLLPLIAIPGARSAAFTGAALKFAAMMVAGAFASAKADQFASIKAGQTTQQIRDLSGDQNYGRVTGHRPWPNAGVPV